MGAVVETLSKSDFILGKECPFKLKYKKAGYPSTREDDPFAEFFAKGGFMVEALAHAILSIDPRVEFEKTISHGRFHARVDAFLDRGDAIVITEIKSVGVNSDQVDQFLADGGMKVKGDWQKYMNDLTYQVMVAELAYPGREIIGRLCAVDKSKTSSIESIFANIEIVREDKADKSAPRAVYRGDVEALRGDHFLAVIDAGKAIKLLMPEVRSKASELMEFLDGDHPHVSPQLSISLCKKCEYRGADLDPSGFESCWGTKGGEPLSIDLYQGGRGAGLVSAIGENWTAGKRSIRELPDSVLEGGKSFGPPRRNQVRSARTNQEVVEPALADSLADLSYPLHFVDFETSSIPVPFHPEMRPYETVAFQFSVHSVETKTSSNLRHSEWLNLRDTYPNLEFLEALRLRLGEIGSVVTWSPHEANTLRQLRSQLQMLNKLDPGMDQWIRGLVGAEDGLMGRGRIVDFLQLSREFFAHPQMNGSHSIKKVLDAIWPDAEHLWAHPWFEDFVVRDGGNTPVDPYQALITRDTTGITIAEHSDDDAGNYAVSVNQGVAAMEAYQALLFGERRNDLDYAERLKRALREYCRLDTAAMVMVWVHWRHRLGLLD